TAPDPAVAFVQKMRQDMAHGMAIATRAPANLRLVTSKAGIIGIPFGPVTDGMFIEDRIVEFAGRWVEPGVHDYDVKETAIPDSGISYALLEHWKGKVYGLPGRIPVRKMTAWSWLPLCIHQPRSPFAV